MPLLGRVAAFLFFWHSLRRARPLHCRLGKIAAVGRVFAVPARAQYFGVEGRGYTIYWAKSEKMSAKNMLYNI